MTLDTDMVCWECGTEMEPEKRVGLFLKFYCPKCVDEYEDGKLKFDAEPIRRQFDEEPEATLKMVTAELEDTTTHWSEDNDIKLACPFCRESTMNVEIESDREVVWRCSNCDHIENMPKKQDETIISCTRCSTALVVQNVGDGITTHCPNCGGYSDSEVRVLLTKDELTQLLASHRMAVEFHKLVGAGRGETIRHLHILETLLTKLENVLENFDKERRGDG